MDNALVINRHKAHRENQERRISRRRNSWHDSKKPRSHWRERNPDAYQRWVESTKPESLNMFLALHGPSRIPKVREYVQFKVQPYLEITDRTDPDAPAKILPLGKNSTMDIIGLVDFKQLADKRRNLYKVVVFVVQNNAAYLGLEAPEGYEGKLPFYKQHIYCPLAGAKFHMLYAVPRPLDICQGVISKIYTEDGKLREQYVPREFQP